MNWTIPPESLPVFDYLIRFTLIFFMAWLAGHYVLQHKHPKRRVQLLRISLVGVVLLPFFQWLTPGIALPFFHSSQPEFVLKQDINNLAGSSQTQAVVGAPTEEETTGFHNESKTIVQSKEQSEKIFSLSVKRILITASGLWAMIVMILTYRAWRSHRQVQCLFQSTVSAPEFLHAQLKRIQCRMGLLRTIALCCSDSVQSPFVYGVRQPVIVIPSSLLKTNSRIHFSAVLAHELAHIQTKDLWWMSAFRWMRIVFWFHPIAWIINANHDLSCEENSDQIAINTLLDPASYSQSLARMAIQMTNQKPLLAGVSMARPSQIRYRLDKLQQTTYAPTSQKSNFAFLLCSVFIVFTIAGFKQVEAQVPTVTNVLQKMVELRDKLTDFYMDIHMQETNCNVNEKNVKEGIVDRIFDHKVYKKGKKYSIETEGVIKNPGQTEYKFQYSGKAVGGTGEQIILDTHLNKSSGKPIYVVIEKETKYSHVQYLHGDFGMVLGGDNNLSWMTFINETNATLNTDPLDGVECLKIVSENDNGLYEIWIDPKAGYNVRMAKSTKRSRHLYGELPFSMAFSWLKMIPVRCESVYRTEEIEKVGEHYVITKDSYVDKIINKNGSYTEYRVEKFRKNIQFNPDFEKRKAFELDIPNGTPVTEYVIDDNLKKGGFISSRPIKDKYIWKYGKVVPINQ